jgi:hypothetical protein
LQSDISVHRGTACSLYEIEDTLAALGDSVNTCESIENRSALLAQIGEALCTARDKRDRVVAFLRYCADQEKFADEEIARLESRKRHIARVREELETYVIQVIQQCATPDRNGIRRLEGNVSAMRLQKNPDTVLITNIEAVPLAYKQAVLALPAYVWEALLNCVSVQERQYFEKLVTRIEFRADKRQLTTELKAGTPIAGAHLRSGDMRLVIT